MRTLDSQPIIVSTHFTWSQFNWRYWVSYHISLSKKFHSWPYSLYFLDYYETEEYKEFRLVHVVLRPMLIILGTLGNVLSLWIMRSRSLRNISTCFYLSALAIADTGESSKLKKTHTLVKKFWLKTNRGNHKEHEAPETILKAIVTFSLGDLIAITSNDRPFGCPIICADIFHNASLFIDTSNSAWYNQAHCLICTPICP